MIDESSSPGLISTAVDDFYTARRKAALESILGTLQGKPTDLLSYDEVRNKLRAIESSRRILKEIPINQIVGSVNRYTDFSRSFLPRVASDSQRWARVRLGVTSMKGLPPIEAYQIGDVYFVLDGHHRVSVARELGQENIEGYVIPVITRVPLSPSDRPDDIILKAEYADFLEKTNLDKLRPDTQLIVTAPGQYEKLLEHINVHRYFASQKRGSELPYPEAVTSWYDEVYQPVARTIRDHNLLRDFPGRTETDLYLWIMEHRSALSGSDFGWEVPSERAAVDFAARYSPTPRRRLPRLGRRLIDFLVPDPLEAGPPPGTWRAEHQSPHRGDRLFDDLLVTVRGGKDTWDAVKTAVEVARREDARLTGLHLLSGDRQPGSPEVVQLQETFSHYCAEAGIFGRLIVERGEPTPELVQRSAWVDLLVFRLNYPPPSKPLQRLRSGARVLIQRSRAPVFAVPDAHVNLDSALLVYGLGRKSEEALFVATYLAGRWHIPLTVLLTRDRRQRTSSSELESRARRYLEEHGIQARYIDACSSDSPDPAVNVLVCAEEHEAGFVIMGGYESSPLLESLLGSPLDHVLRSIRRPVLICG